MRWIVLGVLVLFLLLSVLFLHLEEEYTAGLFMGMGIAFGLSAGTVMVIGKATEGLPSQKKGDSHGLGL